MNNLNKYKTSFLLAIKNLKANVGRTFLTLLGIVIGILAVILVMSSGEGVKRFVIQQAESFGSDIMQIEVKVPSTGAVSSTNATAQAMGVQITTLTNEDGDEIGEISNVDKWYGATIGQEIASYRNENKRVMLFGAGSQAPLVDPNIKIEKGTFYSESDDRSLSQVVVIGKDIEKEFFGNTDPVGKNIRIKGQNYRVIGVLQERGTISFFNFDEVIYIPVKTLQKKILGVDYIRFISLTLKDKNLSDVTAAEITDILRRRHDITNPDADDFLIMTIEEAREMIDTMFKALNILLLALTSVSLIVGGVGIMNVMYVAVAERTFEIGLRKALGAHSSDILRQFLFEAILVTMVGGILGIVIGTLLLIGGEYIAGMMGYVVDIGITKTSILIAVSFSVCVGVFFGYYPARSASRITPMEAMRKE